MDNNRAKTINGKKPYYYQDIIYYIKNENKDIKTLPNPTTKNIYQKIIQDGSKQHKVPGENQWKNHIPTIEFLQIWKNTFISYAKPFCKDLHYRVPHYSTKTNQYMRKCMRHKPRMWLVQTDRGQYPPFYKMPQNQKHLGILSTNTDKTRREKPQYRISSTHSKR